MTQDAAGSPPSLSVEQEAVEVQPALPWHGHRRTRYLVITAVIYISLAVGEFLLTSL